MLREDPAEQWVDLEAVHVLPERCIFYFFLVLQNVCLCSRVYWQMTRTEDGQWQWAQCRPTAHTHTAQFVLELPTHCRAGRGWICLSVICRGLQMQTRLMVRFNPWYCSYGVGVCVCVCCVLADSPLISCFSSCCRAETERGLNRKHIIEGKQFFFFSASSCCLVLHVTSSRLLPLLPSNLPLLSPPLGLASTSALRLCTQPNAKVAFEKKPGLPAADVLPFALVHLLSFMGSDGTLSEHMTASLCQIYPELPPRCLASWLPGPRSAACMTQLSLSAAATCGRY